MTAADLNQTSLIGLGALCQPLTDAPGNASTLKRLLHA